MAQTRQYTTNFRGYRHDTPSYTTQFRYMGSYWVVLGCGKTHICRLFLNGWVMSRYPAWWAKYNYILVHRRRRSY